MVASGRLLPSLLILALTLFAALPWGVESDYRFVLPHLVYAVIHYFTLRREAQVPEIIVFTSGLTLDVLTGGPLGYWSLVFLIGYAIAALQAPAMGSGRGRRWALAAMALALVALFEWALASLYYLELADWRPIALGAAGVALAYPMLAFVLQSFASASSARGQAFRD